MQNPAGTNIVRANSHLAANNARVTRVINGFIAGTGPLLDALQRRDWQEVVRLSHHVERVAGVRNRSRVSAVARHVREATQAPVDEAELGRRVDELMYLFERLTSSPAQGY